MRYVASLFAIEPDIAAQIFNKLRGADFTALKSVDRWFSGSMKQATSKKLYDYWNLVRGSREAPRRFEIEPAQISHILPETFVAEHSEDDVYTFRLSGTHIDHALGRALKGINLLSFWGPDDCEAVRGVLHCVTEDACIGVLEFSADNASGVSTHFEMTFMPLLHSNQRINRLLGNITPVRPSPHPGGARLENFTVQDVDLVWPDLYPSFMSEDDLAEIGADQPPDIVTTGYSRIVRSDRRCFRVYDGGRKDNNSI